MDSELQGVVIAGVFTVIGGLLGQVGAYVQGRRDDSRRWETDVRELGLRFYREAQNVGLARANQTKLYQAYEELITIAKPKLVEACHDLLLAAQTSAEAQRVADEGRGVFIVEPMGSALTQFLDAMRVTFGVKSLHPPK